MDIDDPDDLSERFGDAHEMIVRGESVPEGEYPASHNAIDEMVRAGWLDRDDEGRLVRGELLDLHLGLVNE